MKPILTFLVLAFALPAAEIIVTVKNDAGVTVSTSTLTTSNSILAAINNWRLAQVLTPAQPACPACVPPILATPGVLKYPTAAALWKAAIKAFIPQTLTDYHPAIIAERAKIDAANAEIKRLEDAFAQ